MRFGAAKEIITPFCKMNLQGFAGYFGNDFKTIHDDIFAHALILEDDRMHKALIVTLDVLFHDYSLTEEIMRFSSDKCFVSPDNVIVNYSHTHNGPALKNYNQWTYSREYEDYLAEAIKRCILGADLACADGEASFAVVEGDWNMSRRLIENGECRFRPNPYGGRNKKINILRFTDKDGSARAVLMNYACHPSSAGAGSVISGEYPGRLCQLIDSMLYGNTSLFMQGFAGDTKSRYAVSDDLKNFRSINFKELDLMASGMFDAVRQAFINNSFKSIELDLSGRHFITPLAINAYPKSYFEEQSKTIEPGYMTMCLRHIIDHYNDLLETLHLQSAILKLSDNIYVMALGGEPSFDMEAVFREAFPDKTMIFAGYCDDIAYIPTDKMIREGGYEADGSVIEYRLKGSIAAGVNETVAKYFKENMMILDK